ncbi:hypothetical protein HNR42_000791 [Deinobacterium chartae]|uniref:DUF1330 domain-containing protein n=1 Tax=Deinobacterium chartae TaxID=521158 RepID=A0A841HVG9_9DEIO|nr:hypothetical protein [Deinobacterium chartae]MBB6097377.1 hypothetical protein [Deinobacterium chartae]
MQLIQILLPRSDNDGRPLEGALYRQVRLELIERFGGLTAYVRAPAEGLWQPEDGEPPVRDEVLVYEVMAETLEREWWAEYREALRQRFRQRSLIIRAQPLELL